KAAAGNGRRRALRAFFCATQSGGRKRPPARFARLLLRHAKRRPETAAGALCAPSFAPRKEAARNGRRLDPA
ncbi:MAG TPA: hypothetical protein VEJ16_04020, partial [Alphaproteobacteria bacterium]|nr:hypothetical protein [Alphaproteobacteria bacterium]